MAAVHVTPQHNEPQIVDNSGWEAPNYSAGAGYEDSTKHTTQQPWLLIQRGNVKTFAGRETSRYVFLSFKKGP